MTIKNVHNLFDFTSQKMVLINSFNYGTTYEFNSKNEYNYPQLYLEYPIMIDTVTKANKVYSISFDLIDRVDQVTPQISRVNIVSKMEQLAYQIQEVIAKDIKPLNSTFIINNIITILDEWSDKVSGVHIEASLSTPNEVQICEILVELGSFSDYINNRGC